MRLMKSLSAIVALFMLAGPACIQNTAMANGVCCIDSWQGPHCIATNELTCAVFYQGTWHPSAHCDDFNCNEVGPCCLGNDCINLELDECLDVGGTFHHETDSCDDDMCSQPTIKGACCDADVSIGDGCILLPESECNDLGGTYQGDFSNCETSCGCPGDLNNDQNIGVDDLLIVLSEYGLSCTDGCLSDFDESGNVNIDDLLTMLSYYGLPCS
tara:strand:- start:2881 stop:3522 length:642 start_codon:yes stop_codon:yes gene_type:complete